LLIVEAAEAVPWTKPVDLPFEPGRPLPKLGAPDRDEFLAVLADGSVRFLPRRIEQALLRALITRNGGEHIEWSKLGPAIRPAPAP